MKALFEIEGYHAVLPHVQNVYPVQKDEHNWYWGFKYKSQIFEFLYYKNEKEAEKIHDKFIEALNSYWLK